MRNFSMVIVGIMLCGLLLTGCGAETTSPDQVVNQYWQHLKADETEKAYSLIAEGREYEIGDMGISEMDELTEHIWNRFSLKADGYEIDGDVAIVDVRVTKPNLLETMETYLESVFGELMEFAFSGATDEEIEQKAEELLVEALEGADDITHNEKAEMRKEDGEWKIYQWDFANIERRMDEIDEMFSDLE